jgi:hypothetical protein
MRMVKAGVAFLLVLAVALGGCARFYLTTSFNVENYYALEPSLGKGLLALSFTANPEVPNMTLRYRRAQEFLSYGEITLWTHRNPLDWTDPKGRLVVIELPEGHYEFYDMVTALARSGVFFSIPFSITSGKVTYLGNVQVTFKGFKYTVQVQDMSSRDVPLLLQRYPRLGPTDLGRTESRTHETTLQYSANSRPVDIEAGGHKRQVNN